MPLKSGLRPWRICWRRRPNRKDKIIHIKSQGDIQFSRDGLKLRIKGLIWSFRAWSERIWHLLEWLFQLFNWILSINNELKVHRCPWLQQLTSSSWFNKTDLPKNEEYSKHGPIQNLKLLHQHEFEFRQLSNNTIGHRQDIHILKWAQSSCSIRYETKEDTDHWTRYEFILLLICWFGALHSRTRLLGRHDSKSIKSTGRSQ